MSTDVPDHVTNADDEPVVKAAYTPDVLRGLMVILRRVSAIRAKLESEITREHEAEVSQILAESGRALGALRTKYDSEIATARQEFATVLQKADVFHTTELKKLGELKDARSKLINSQCARVLADLNDDEGFDKLREGESRKSRGQQPKLIAAKAEKELARGLGQLEEAVAQSARFLAVHGVKDVPTAAEVSEGGEAAEEAVVDDNPLAAVTAASTAAQEQAAAVCDLPAVKRAFSGGLQGAVIAGPIGAGLLVAALLVFVTPGGVALRAGVAGSAAVILLGGGLAAGLVYVGGLRTKVRREMMSLHAELVEAVSAGRRLEAACHAWIRRRQEDQARRLEEQSREESDKRAAEYEGKRTVATSLRDAQLAELESKYQDSVQKLLVKVTDHRAAANAKFPPRIEALEAAMRERIEKREQERDAALTATDTHRNERWDAMTAHWQEAREATAAIYAASSSLDAEAFPAWDDLAREDTPLPTEPPPGLRFGDLALSLQRVPGGVSSVPDLNAFGPIDWSQPATMPWPIAASLMIKASPDDKESSSAMMQAVMLRIATGIPAGQSRFTIIDPLGLGKQYAGFMHLADHDELLVTSRIWTEPQLIEQKLADITEQMEVVIQKYLRNEYSSIGAYNADAEVPEPYRFVVVANFPANFNETSARRLSSIASSGARCGVYVIMSVDPKLQMPSGFSLADVEQHSTVVKLEKGQFTWVDPEFSKWPLTVERAPPDETFTKIIQRVGRAAKAAKRVVVPFDRVAPKIEDWWRGSTAEEVTAPLGPAGAKKLQYLKLGRGTSQHLLIAGKTGSGKSTLMHAMITSLALQYSPNEIQFYLIDFKKGVEFKLYDHYALPHARVIAIESEREFGLSVMEQLDRELKRRGDLFRELSVQNVAGFRQTGHADPMPRILLLIDEFQEIFVEDDKIAQDASLILDRLVRQGRAFGIHVLLGSQTLGGSYSLPRATMGQMAVRIALQCNEADSSLILSDENTAARLLTRPGEAIYNDANGMIDGNNPFQVVFLTDEQREQYLGDLRKLADRRTDIPQLNRIVFDGNQAADPALNPLLTEMLDKGSVQGHELLAPLAWLGDAIAIKDPTAAIFRRQGGANMLIAGQREDLGTSLLAMSIVSLAAEHDPHPGGALGRVARFVVLEPAIAEEKRDIMLAGLAQHLPHEIEIAGRLGVAGAMEALATEVRRRLDEQVLDGEAVFLVIRDLGRFRELRKADGDFGFGGFGGEKKAGPGDNLLTVLRDGPPVGIHLITWCDSLTNLQRTFDRGAIKEFELRVLFQMSSSDSSTLVDTPVAAKLGPNRGLFIHEETGTLEKFRPYSFPTPEWLGEVSAKMRARTQGTPVVRTGAATELPPTSDKPSGFSFGGGGDFNFTKLLDDAPDGAASNPVTEPPNEG